MATPDSTPSPTDARLRARRHARAWRRVRQLGLVALGAALGALYGATSVEDGRDLERGALALSTIALLTLGFEWVARRRGRTPRRAVMVAAYLVLGGLGLAASQNWFRGQLGYAVHPTDFLHYYLGARYFEELGYSHLYVCSAAAAQQLGAPTGSWHVRDLRTNEVVALQRLRPQMAECQARFGPGQWSAFVEDVRVLAKASGGRQFRIALNDHGFNPSPIWVLLPRALLPLVGATAAGAMALTGVDALFVVLGAWLLLRTFGVRTFALALLFLGCHAPNRYDWVGGSLLRMDWWFWCVVSLAALARRREGLAGAAWAYASALRIFPAVLGIGALLGLAARGRPGLSREPRRAGARAARLLAGAAAASLALLALTLLLGPPTQTWGAFVSNIGKHRQTTSLNLIGLEPLLDWALPPAQVEQGSSAQPGPGAGPWHAAISLGALLVAFLALLRISRGLRCAATVAALSLGLVPILLPLSCYYMSVLALLAVAARRLRGLGVWMVGAAWASQALQQASVGGRYLSASAYFALLSALDLLLVAGFYAAFVWLTRARGPGPLPEPGPSH